MKEKKMEEIQARRGFFKSASKGVMPVISLLDVTISAKLFGGGDGCVCGHSCSGYCDKTCYKGCENRCSGCGSACYTSCHNNVGKGN